MSDALPIVDAHHHLWDLARGPVHYPWLQDPEPHDFFLGDYARLKRDYLPEDYRRDAAGHDVVKTVHVEAECSREQQVAETEWLTALHAKHGMPDAIVPHAWFHTPDAAAILERQASFPMVRGIRSKPFRDGMMQEKAWLAGYALLERLKLSWDLRVKTWELEEAAAVVRAHPGIAVVLNHTGFPWDRSDAGLEVWRRGMRSLAASPHCHCKLSCLCLLDGPWDYESNRRVVLEAIGIFGTERCMFASNFPVDGLRVSFRQMFDDFKRMTRDLSSTERRALFHDNAVRFYRL
ncbi:MAG: amidohydrolase family protein [Proteobacteria bacterium]|nr:amidohydrolase family protein [Pseudomonadota bacterium]